MARKEIGTGWNRDNRNNMNDNFIELYNKQSSVDDLAAALTEEEETWEVE